MRVCICASEWDLFNPFLSLFSPHFAAHSSHLRLHCKEISRVYSRSTMATTAETSTTKAVNNIVFLFIHSKRPPTIDNEWEWMEWLTRQQEGPNATVKKEIQYKISTEIESGFFVLLCIHPNVFFVEANSFALHPNKWSERAWFSITSHQIAFFFFAPVVVTVLLSLEYPVFVDVEFLYEESDYFNPRLFSN